MTDRIRMALLTSGVALVVSSCDQAKAPTAAAVPTQEEAKAIVEKTEATFNSQNAATIMAQYAPGAVMFDVVEPAPSDDRAVQTKWTDAFVAMKPTGFRVPDRRVQVLDADTVIASGTATADTAAPGGPKTVTIRYTDVYEKQPDGGWLIVHEHLSGVPGAKPAG